MPTTNNPQKIATAYNSKFFKAKVRFEGIDTNTGQWFEHYFEFDHEDPEFTQMLNDYAARQMAERLAAEWLPVTPGQPADNVAVKVQGIVYPVYRNGDKWFSATSERRLQINPPSYQIAKPKI